MLESVNTEGSLVVQLLGLLETIILSAAKVMRNQKALRY